MNKQIENIIFLSGAHRYNFVQDTDNTWSGILTVWGCPEKNQVLLVRALHYAILAPFSLKIIFEEDK